MKRAWVRRQGASDEQYNIVASRFSTRLLDTKEEHEATQGTKDNEGFNNEGQEYIIIFSLRIFPLKRTTTKK